MTLGQLIQRLLDDTGTFNRWEWAQFLSVPAETLEDWINDKAIPQASLLRMMLDALGPSPMKAEFDILAKKPAEEISPLGHLMLPTVAVYVTNAGFQDLGRRLDTLPPEAQRKALNTGSWD